MTVGDLIRAGGSMTEGAYALDAELTRYSVVNGEFRTKEIIGVDLRALLDGDSSADLSLSPHDHVKISLVPDWRADWSMTIDGEVRFPGRYQVRVGETLASVLERAGGLTEHAFPEGAIFLRESLKEREREQIDILVNRMEADLTALSLETLDTTGAEALTTGKSLVDQLRSTEPVGRLVIDVSQITPGSSRTEVARNIELRNGDVLLVPTRPQEVSVIGEVQQTTSHLYQAGLTREDYIQMSGGMTRRADTKLIYVVRASGAVVTASRSKWFGRASNAEIRPGDTIVVPLETDRIRPLTFWTNVTQILYQGAIAVAAIQSFN
jgi:protein involved in polysaccharide export with SLBB domain